MLKVGDEIVKRERADESIVRAAIEGVRAGWGRWESAIEGEEL